MSLSAVRGISPGHNATSVLVPPMSSVRIFDLSAESGSGKPEGAHDPAGRPAEHKAGGTARRLFPSDDATVRLHDAHSPRRHGAFEPVQVPRHDGLHIDIHDGCSRTFVLPVFRQNIRAQRESRIRKVFLQMPAAFRSCSGYRNEKRNTMATPATSRRCNVSPNPATSRSSRGVRIEPAAATRSVTSKRRVLRHERGRAVLGQRIQCGTVLAPDRQDVAETSGSNEGAARTAMLEKRIRGSGRAVRNSRSFAGPEQPDGLPPRRDTLVIRRGGRLANDRRSALQVHKIRERAARVDPDAFRHAG